MPNRSLSFLQSKCLAGLTSKLPHDHRSLSGLRGSLRPQLASIFNHRPEFVQPLLYPHCSGEPSKKQQIFLISSLFVRNLFVPIDFSPSFFSFLYAWHTVHTHTLAPFASNASAHALTVQPVVTTSSTRQIRFPSTAASASNAPYTLALLCKAPNSACCSVCRIRRSQSGCTSASIQAAMPSANNAAWL